MSGQGRPILFALTLSLFLIAVSGCSCSEDMSLSGGPSGTGYDAPSRGKAETTGASRSSPAGSSSSEHPTPPSQPSWEGWLTAGSVDDHLNFETFQKFLKKTVKAHWNLPTFEPRVATPRFRSLGRTAQQMDITFVLDTTGSMSDELRYLTREIGYIVSQVRKNFPQIDIRFSSIEYRDQGDAYTSKQFRFTKSLSDFQKHLSQQSASGGGDYPEAAHEALRKASLQSWRAGAKKIAFWIADAPPHNQHMKDTLESFKSMQKQSIRLYPIAASGALKKAEYIMRIGAFLTQSQYLFLTDDSGIGDSHEEPDILCYHVEKLKDLIVRMIRSEVSEKRIQPKTSQILRTVGNPQQGKCMVK